MKILVLLFACAIAWADFTPSAWRYRKRLPVEAGKPIGAVHIDRQVYARAQAGLEDLRIVRGSEETPYLITRLSGSHERKEVAVTILDRAAVDAGVRFDVAMDGSVKRHSRITFETEQTNFRKRVRLEASADRKNWALVRKEAYIFDFTYEAQHSRILTVEYPVSTQPYLRVTVEGWRDPAAISGATVSLAEDRPPVREVMQEFRAPAPVEDAKAKANVYTLDFRETGVPKDQLRLEVEGDALFHRAVDVEASDDGKGYAPHARGVIFHVGGERSLWIAMPDTRSRYLRVRVFHGDDKPLALQSIVAEAILRKVIFPVNAAGDYWLYYGSAGAKRPAYDLPMVLAKSSVESAVTVNAAPEETNAGYVAPPPPTKPFSDRYPELLWGALAVAVLAIGFLTVQFLKKAAIQAE